MLRANIFSFFSKKKIFFKRQGKKGEFFFVGFFVVVDVWHNYFCVFFLLFSLSFRIQLCMYVVVDSKKLSLRLRFHFIFSIRFLCFRFFLKENFSAFFWFHSFFFVFVSRFLYFQRFFSQQGGRRQLEVDFFSELEQENHIKDYKKQID